MENLKEEIYNSLLIRSYLFKYETGVINEVIQDDDIYKTFLLTLVSILNCDNIFLLDSNITSRAISTVNEGYLKFDYDNNIINVCRKKIDNYVKKSINTPHDSKYEQVYYWMLDEKSYRNIDIPLTKEEIFNLNVKDINNYNILIGKTDNFDDLELFSFISTGFLLVNCYKDIFKEIPILKESIRIIAEYLYKNNQCDIRYRKYVYKYYKALLETLNLKENKKVFKIVK